MTEQTLTGHKAYVTGGASGIGLAIAQALAAHGAKVVIVDLNGDAAAEVAAQLGGEALRMDLGDTKALDSLSLDADILVNCAGIQHVAPIAEFDPERFRLIHRIMLEAPFLLIRASLPHMYSQGFGRIINISSVHGLIASPFKSAYVSAKHGLEGLSKVTALEGAEHGVTSVCINPGYVKTPLVEQQIPDQAKTHGMSEEEVVEKVLLAGHAIKEFVAPEDLGEIVAFIAGPHAAMISGTDIVVDGGWIAK